MISPDQEKADMLSYSDELGDSRLPRHTERARAIPAGQLGSSEWFEKVGHYWEEARENNGVERYDLAEKAGVHVNIIRFLELGLAYPEELQGNLLPQLSLCLTGNMSTFEAFSQRYNVSEIPVRTPRFKLLPFIAPRWVPMHQAT